MVVAESRVALPRGAEGPIEVYVNGVRQQEGKDFVRRDGELVFSRSLAGGPLGFWRWLSLFLGVAGTYRQTSVDVSTQSPETNRRLRVAYPGGGADRGHGAIVNRQRHPQTASPRSSSSGATS
jgi:hypothetical protein